MKICKIKFLLFPAVFFAVLFILSPYIFPGCNKACADVQKGNNLNNKNLVASHIFGNRVVFNRNKDIFIVTGNVLIKRKDFKLTANKLVYYYKSNFAIATGNVVVYSKGEITRAERLEIHLTSKIGTIYDSHIHYLDKSIYIYGEKIYSRGKGFYQVKNGYITSCGRRPPSWKIYSGFADIQTGGYAFSFNSIFYIHNIPVLYLPLMVIPIKTKKSSGLLLPTAGYSALTGFQAGDGYYFDLGRSQDITYNLSYYSFLGFGNSLKYRYSLNPDSQGSIYGFYMHERDNAESLAMTPSLTRYLLFSKNKDFLGNLALKTNINIPSDSAFYTDFSTNIFQMTQNRLSSNISATYDFDSFSSRINFLRLDNLFISNYSTEDEYPSLSLYGQTRLGSFLKNPVFLNINASMDNFRSSAYLNDERLDLFPEVYMPFDFLDGIHITPKAGIRYTGYYNIVDGYTGTRENNRNRKIFYEMLESNATFYRNFKDRKNNGGGYLALATPFINYNLIRPTSQEKLPLIDMTDFIPPESAFKYGLRFNLEGYSDKGIKNLLRFSVYQYHSISGNFINPVNYFNYDNLNSDIIARIKFHPTSRLYFFGSGSYDDYNYIFHNYNIGSELIDSRNDSFGLGYTEVNDIQGYLTALNMFNPSNSDIFPQTTASITDLETLSYASLSANLKIIDGFSIDTSENIDLTIHKDVSNSFGVIYQSGCIGFIANYINLPYFHQWAFSFGIILKGIGTYGFGNMLSTGPSSETPAMGPGFGNTF